VEPEFRDTIGDPVDREHRGWDPKMIYRNKTGRNDIVAAKVSWDNERVYFYVGTSEPLSPVSGTNWMNLFIDVDSNGTTGWLGYDVVVNFPKPSSLSRHIGESKAFNWAAVNDADVQLRAKGNELELSMRWSALGPNRPSTLDFKWADNCIASEKWSDFTLNGDAAPNDRFNYRVICK
jgi:hypothetical protein